MLRVPGLRTAAVAAVSLCVIAACSAGASAHTSASSSVVVANTSSVQKLDPDVVTNFLDFQALGLIYDTLVKYNSKLQLTPDLATSWKFSNGNKTLTFQLRKGVTFQDGTTFTSANVVASLNRVKDPKTADASASFIATVTKIVPDGTYAVKLDALAARHLGARRAHLDQPGDALDQVDRGRDALQAARRNRAVRVRELEPEQLVHRQGQPDLVGRQDLARAGRDQDDPERAVDRLGARGEHRPDRADDPAPDHRAPAELDQRPEGARPLLPGPDASGQDGTARERLQPSRAGVRAQPPAGGHLRRARTGSRRRAGAARPLRLEARLVDLPDAERRARRSRT